MGGEVCKRMPLRTALKNARVLSVTLVTVYLYKLDRYWNYNQLMYNYSVILSKREILVVDSQFYCKLMP